MIEYPERSRRAIARLFSRYNDVDIYVEDKSYVGVYERLFQRALRGRVNITKVIPLGPKSVVLDEASKDLSPNGKPRLYIVDGDLDLIAFGRQKSYPHLYRLNVYSLENVLMEQSALIQYCAFAAPGHSSGACAGAVQPEKLLEDLSTLVPYVILLAIARRLALSGSVYAINPPSVTQTVRGRHIGPDERKVYSRKREIIKSIINEVGIQKYRLAKQAVLNTVEKRRLGDHRIVPAKNFGMMYFNERVIAAGGTGLNQKIVASYLAENAEMKFDKRLVARIKKVANRAKHVTVNP